MLQERAKVAAEALQIEREIRLERRDRKSNDTVQSLAKFIRSHEVVISQEAGGLKCGLTSAQPADAEVLPPHPGPLPSDGRGRPVANQHPRCSAAWFERTASPAQVRTIYRFSFMACASSGASVWTNRCTSGCWVNSLPKSWTSRNKWA